MKDAPSAPIAIMAGVFVVICCAGPLLIAAIGAAGLAAWFMNTAYVWVPAILMVLAIGIYRYHGYRTSGPDGGQITRDRKALHHE
ncbi:MAG: hypothetical protein GHHEDOFH_00585 [Pseudorhodoplanes sp.]|nr:hypothetical protein [Pseudorhodoplanes sp.]